MKIKSAVFEISAPDLPSCPNWLLPEFALIGRSNVGKSSLINLLTEQRGLAMTSSMPGKTKLINFFRINTNWSLVDLPGYGYAKVATQDKHEFNKAVSNYIEKRRVLSLVFVLIDSRIDPQQIDLDFLHWLVECDVDFALIFTKTDKQTTSQTQARIATFLATIAGFVPEAPTVFSCSAVAKKGAKEILGHIAKSLAAARS